MPASVWLQSARLTVVQQPCADPARAICFHCGKTGHHRRDPITGTLCRKTNLQAEGPQIRANSGQPRYAQHPRQERPQAQVQVQQQTHRDQKSADHRSYSSVVPTVAETSPETRRLQALVAQQANELLSLRARIASLEAAAVATQKPAQQLQPPGATATPGANTDTGTGTHIPERKRQHSSRAADTDSVSTTATATRAPEAALSDRVAKLDADMQMLRKLAASALQDPTTISSNLSALKGRASILHGYCLEIVRVLLGHRLAATEQFDRFVFGELAFFDGVCPAPRSFRRFIDPDGHNTAIFATSCDEIRSIHGQLQRLRDAQPTDTDRDPKDRQNARVAGAQWGRHVAEALQHFPQTVTNLISELSVSPLSPSADSFSPQPSVESQPSSTAAKPVSAAPVSHASAAPLSQAPETTAARTASKPQPPVPAAAQPALSVVVLSKQTQTSVSAGTTAAQGQAQTGTHTATATRSQKLATDLAPTAAPTAVSLTPPASASSCLASLTPAGSVSGASVAAAAAASTQTQPTVPQTSPQPASAATARALAAPASVSANVQSPRFISASLTPTEPTAEAKSGQISPAAKITGTAAVEPDRSKQPLTETDRENRGTEARPEVKSPEKAKADTGGSSDQSPGSIGGRVRAKGRGKKKGKSRRVRA